MLYDGLVMFEESRESSTIEPQEHESGFMAMLPNWTQSIKAGTTVCDLIRHINDVEKRYLFVHTLGLGDKDGGKRIQVEKQIVKVSLPIRLCFRSMHVQNIAAINQIADGSKLCV